MKSFNFFERKSLKGEIYSILLLVQNITKSGKQLKKIKELFYYIYIVLILSFNEINICVYNFLHYLYQNMIFTNLRRRKFLL